MKYPTFAKSGYKTAKIPFLSGGLNLRESLDSVLDNQLTDCVNMYAADSFLKTRPGIGAAKLYTDVLSNTDYSDIKLTAHDIYKTVTDQNLGTSEVCRLVSAVSKSQNIIHLFLVGKNIFKKLPSLPHTGQSFFVVSEKDVLYLFSDDYKIYSLSDTDTAWADCYSKIYIPTVAVDCVVEGINYNGVLNESYNLLADKYHILYNSKNPNHQPIDQSNLHQMVYYNTVTHDDITSFAGCTVQAEFTDSFGKKTNHSVTLGADGTGKETTSSDGLYMFADANYIVFYTDPEYFNVANKKVSDPDLKNDLKITFPIKRTDKEKNKVFKANINTWFGGGTQSSGGSRLFLGANSNEPNLVHWSDLNNPLYFPENNYFYVGDSSQKVTAFGKQSDMLVIFKENETYFTRYTQNSKITADDVLTGNVTDILSQSVYFPLTLIHSAIGCDNQNTVQLCRNRLVWVSGGEVYTLCSYNMYSENNIYPVGQMISRKLRGDNNLPNAVSCDFEGRYLIFLGQNAYVMDYESYGYQNVSSYTQSQDSNLKIPWHYFLFSGWENSIIFTVGNSLNILGTTPGGLVTANINESYKTDSVVTKTHTGQYQITEQPIFCSFKTKLFGLSAPEKLKDITSITLTLGNTTPKTLTAKFITDTKTNTCIINHTKPAVDTFSSEFIWVKTVNVFSKSVLRFGLELSCNGQMAVQGINVNYKILGGA